MRIHDGAARLNAHRPVGHMLEDCEARRQPTTPDVRGETLTWCSHETAHLFRWAVTVRFHGADKRDRTADLLITNQLLYQLSYVGLLLLRLYRCLASR